MDAIDRSKQIYGPPGGTFNEAKLTWRLSHGDRIGRNLRKWVNIRHRIRFGACSAGG
jgi:hypothetical protein